MKKLFRVAALALAGGLFAGSALAHGDLYVQIAAVSEKLRQQPAAELFLKRGELYRAHAEWDAALADFDRAAKLNPGLDAVLLCRGLTFLAAGKPALAVEALDQFLVRQPAHADGHAARARARVELKQCSAAAADFDRAIALATEPKPEFFIERAQALVNLNNFAGALRGLDAGLKQLGLLPTFQSLAIEIELRREHFEAALTRVDTLIGQSVRKETWLARRGDILVQAARRDEALRAYADALTALEGLPERIRNTPASQQLEARLRAELAFLTENNS